MTCGVYIIESPNGNFYIGSSGNIERRWSDHRKLLRGGKHPNATLQRAWDKYRGSMKFLVALVCRKDDLLLYEQTYIDALNPKYNGSRVAGRIEQTPEMRAHKSRVLKGRYTGRVLSEDHKAAISEGVKRAFARPETKRKLKARKQSVRSAEHRQNLSAALKGRVRSPEHCKAISEAKRRKKFTPSEELRQRWSDIRRAYCQTEAGKEHMKRASRAAHEGKKNEPSL